MRKEYTMSKEFNEENVTMADLKIILMMPTMECSSSYLEKGTVLL